MHDGIFQTETKPFVIGRDTRINDLADIPYMTDEIVVHEDDPDYSVYDGALYSKDHSRFIYCPRKKKKITFHPNTNIIRSYSFGQLYVGGAELTEVILPDGVEVIEDYAFYMHQNLHKLYVPKTVKSIGINAFTGCIWIREMSVLGVVLDYRETFDNISEIMQMITQRDYDVKLHGCYKNHIAVLMMLSGLDGAYEYVSKNILRIFKSLMTYNRQDDIDAVLSVYDVVNAKNIGKLITYAQDKGYPVVLKKLDDYKKNKLKI